MSPGEAVAERRPSAAAMMSFKLLANKECCVTEILQQGIVPANASGLCKAGIALHEFPALYHAALYT
jgi:hypothetical protein